MNAARNTPAVEMRFEDVENFMVGKAKKESLELVQDLESKQMKVLTQKMSKMEDLMRGQGMGYSFNFDDMMQFDRTSYLISSKCLSFRSLIVLEIQGSTLFNIQLLSTPLRLLCL